MHYVVLAPGFVGDAALAAPNSLLDLIEQALRLQRRLVTFARSVNTVHLYSIWTAKPSCKRLCGAVYGKSYGTTRRVICQKFIDNTLN
jgi:hypothetical protein